MTRVPVHDLDSCPDASREPLRRRSKSAGKTLNIQGAMAHSPAVIGLFDAAEQLLAERSHLDPAVREAIHLTVANVNDCGYCQAAYTGAAKSKGFTVEQTLEIRRGAVEDDGKLTVLLAVAREIAGNKGYVRDDTWQAALDAGWTDVELLDAYADVIRAVFTNYFNHLVGTELDLPEAPPLE